MIHLPLNYVQLEADVVMLETLLKCRGVRKRARPKWQRLPSEVEAGLWEVQSTAGEWLIVPVECE